MGNYTEAEIWYNKLKDVGKPALAQIYLDRLFELKLEKSGKDKISETRDEEFENVMEKIHSLGNWKSQIFSNQVHEP